MNKYSFIIPVFNSGDSLTECVQSIEEIGLQDYEILLIDDGSTDGSGELCENLAAEQKNIRCYHQENQGVSAARNRGLRMASGDYVCFFDADDSIEPEKLNRLFSKIESSAYMVDVAVFGMSFDYYHKGKVYRSDLLQTPLDGVWGDREWRLRLVDLFRCNSLSPIWNKVFRRRFLMENRLFLRGDMFLYEDLEYSLRCMACADAVFFEPDVIYHYRQSEDEGNAGRRLLRIAHIYSVVDQIESALRGLGEEADENISQNEQDILLALYLVLAREKIAVSDVKQIKLICDDFADWYVRHHMEIPEERQAFARLLLERKVIRLIFEREYTAIRHRIAVKVKNTRFYQRFRG